MFIQRLAEENLKNHLQSGKIVMVIGARQVGKTTLIKHVLDKKKNVFLNLDIEPDKQRILAASKLSPQDAMASFGNPDYLIIDEAQKLPDIGILVKGWYDAGLPVKIILSGSSSLDLLNRSAESLTGRNIKLFLPPLLFKETIKSRDWYSPVFSIQDLETNFSEQMQGLLMTCLVFGQYPEAVLTSKKQDYLLNLTADYLFKDILQLGMIKTPDLIRKLLALLAHQIGSEVSVSELASGLGIARLTVDRYLELLEQTFVIFRLPAFSTNPRKEIVKNQKIYFWDTGIRNAILNEFSVNPLRSDIGPLWENWAIAEFAKMNWLSGLRKRLYFWRSKSGSEVDLIIEEGKAIKAYEMKWRDGKIKSRAFEAHYGISVQPITSTHPLFEI